MQNLARLAAAFALITIGIQPAYPQQTGIAFVEAAEQASGVCTGDTPEKAMSCARLKCTDGGAEARDCVRVAWCFPSGWSADVFLQHKEGPHWHEYTCGWDSRDAAEKAAALKCDREARPYLIECAAVRFFGPDGKEMLAE